MRLALGLVVLLATLLCVSAAQAATWNGTTVNLGKADGLVMLYEFNCTAPFVDRANGVNLTYLVGAGAACRPDENGTADEAIEFDGVDILVDAIGSDPERAIPDGTMITVFTIVHVPLINQHGLWVLDDGAGGGTAAAFGAFAVGGNAISFGRFTTNDFIEIKDAQLPTANYVNKWSCFAWEYNGTNTVPKEQYTVYHNGQVGGWSNEIAGTPEYINTTFVLGAHTTAGATTFIGNISRLAVYNKHLTRDEQLALCDNFDPYAEDAAGGYNNITIHLDNVYNSTFVQEFSVNIGNSTWNRSYDVTDGALSLNISWGYWLNFTSPIFYPHNVYINATSGGVFSGSTYQAILTVIANEFMSNTSLSAFNATVGSVKNTTANGSTRFFVDAGTYLPIVAPPGYWPGTWIPVTVAAQGFETANASLYSSYITVKASTHNGSSAISTINLNVSWLNYAYFSSNSANNGSVHFYLINGSYNISFTSPGYLPTFVELDVTKYNHTVHLYTWALNTVNITIRNETTLLKLVGPDVLLEFISDDFSYNYSTATGEVFQELLSPSDYLIRYWADTYPRRTYLFSLANETYNEFTLYLLQTGSESNVTITVVDENNNPLEGVKVNALRYNQPTNTYILTESPTTDFTGKARITAKLYTEYYYFQLYYPSVGGTLEKATEPAYLTSTEYTLQIVISDVPGAAFFRQLGIDYNLTFTDATDNFNFEYSDTYGTVTRACLRVYTVAYGGRTAYNSSCAEAASGTLLVGVLEANGTTYEAEAYAEYGGESHFLASLHKTFMASMGSGSTGIFLVIILVIVFGAVAVWSIQVAVVLAGLAPMLAAMAGVLEMPVAATIPPLIIGLALALLLGRKPA